MAKKPTKTQIETCKAFSEYFHNLARDTNMNQPDKQYKDIETLVQGLPLNDGKGGILECLNNIYGILTGG